jgi:hypothetical protein
MMIILWMFTLANNLKKLNENDYREFVDKKCRARLCIYKEEIEERMKSEDSQVLQDDLKKVNIMSKDC